MRRRGRIADGAALKLTDPRQDKLVGIENKNTESVGAPPVLYLSLEGWAL